MPQLTGTYIMEDPREAARLERKVDAEAWARGYLKPHIFDGAEVLSVGCGPANILRAAVNLYPRVSGTGLDLSPARVQRATERNYRVPRMQFVQGDVQQMQFPSGSFDLVYSRMLLQYVPNREKAVSQMVRVAKPGGTVLMHDLDGQLMWHFPEDPLMQQTIDRVLSSLAKSGFDPLVGRKLFWHARNAGLENIKVKVEVYHLIAGEVDQETLEQWKMKLEIAKPRMAEALGSEYEAGEEIRRFLGYLRRPDTLTYCNAFTVTGQKPR